MPYTPLNQIERQRALSQSLRAQPFNRASTLSGLAHVLRQYGAGRGEFIANQREQENAELRKQDMSALISQLRGGPKPGASDRQALREQGVSVLLPEDEQPVTFQHPDVQSAYAGHQMAQALAQSKARTATPSNVAEWNIYSQLPPEQQEQYLRMKRADKVINLGDKQVIPGMLDPTQTTASFEVGLKPGDVPENAAAKAAAQEGAVIDARLGRAPDVAAAEADEARQTATGKAAGEMNVAQYDSATAALGNIEKIDDLITHIDQSEAITGLGAEILKNIERVKALVGSDVAAGKVKDTELLDAMMGSEVFPMIKSLGVGARGMDTPAEREFMRKVLTGEISLNKQTIRQMAQLRKDIALRAVDRWNERVDRGELDDFFSASNIQKRKLGVEDSNISEDVPKGVDPEIWDVMTPEEKALF